METLNDINDSIEISKDNKKIIESNKNRLKLNEIHEEKKRNK